MNTASLTDPWKEKSTGVFIKVVIGRQERSNQKRALKCRSSAKSLITTPSDPNSQNLFDGLWGFGGQFKTKKWILSLLHSSVECPWSVPRINASQSK